MSRPPLTYGIVDVSAVIPSGPDGAARLAAERVRVGVDLALARHRDAVAGDPVTGDRRALEAAADTTLGILPIAVVTPASSRVAASIPDAVRAGARGFWLGADSWYGSAATASAATDELLSAVARSGLPLLVPVTAWGDATAIGVATDGLGITVILVGAHYTHIADDLAAARRFPHLHLETSGLAHLGAVERVVATIGAERLLFGSGMPERPPSAPLNAVLAARIGEDDRRAVLGGNAQRLFGLASASVEMPRPLHAGGKDGSIDVHGHLPPVPWDVPDLDPPALAGAQSDGGVSRTVLSSMEAITAHAPTGNAATVAACADEPRLLGYLVADPNDLDTTADQLRRHGDAPGIVGTKVHCEWSGCDTASAEVAALFDLLAGHGRPVLIHVAGAGWADAMRRLVRTHPQLPVIAAHGGPGAPSVAMAEIAAEADNLHLELASSFASLPAVRRMVDVAGRDRFLFGTDVPLLDPAFVLGTYADAGLTPDATPAVFRGEAVRLFGLGAP